MSSLNDGDKFPEKNLAEEQVAFLDDVEGLTVSESASRGIKPEEHMGLAYYFVGLCVYETAQSNKASGLNPSLRGLRSIIWLHKSLGHPIPVDDLNQSAIEGVMAAVDDFDDKRGATFSAFAGWVIPRVVISAISGPGRTELPIRYPSNVLSGMATRKIERPRFTSIDSTAGRLSLEATERSPLWSSRVEDEALRRIEEDTVWDILLASDILSERERDVLALRFGFATGDAMTLQQIGDIIGLTREGVRRIEKKALNRLRNSKVVKNQLTDY